MSGRFGQGEVHSPRLYIGIVAISYPYNERALPEPYGEFGHPYHQNMNANAGWVDRGLSAYSSSPVRGGGWPKVRRRGYPALDRMTPLHRLCRSPSPYRGGFVRLWSATVMAKNLAAAYPCLLRRFHDHPCGKTVIDLHDDTMASGDDVQR